MEINKVAKNHHIKAEAKSLLVVILIALLIRTFIMELFFVPTGSMKATVLEGDYIFSTKYSYGFSKHAFPFSPDIFSGRVFPREPARGDIIIFRPPLNMDTRYIKRLIGLPGDKIQIINDIIHINDTPVSREESGTFTDDSGQKYKKYKEILPNGFRYNSYKLEVHNRLLEDSGYSNTEIFYVPQGMYFFMGDNRDESRDSRGELGFVPFENFIAKSQFILFSTRELLWLNHGSLQERIAQIGIWFTSIRFDRLFSNIYQGN